MSYSPHNKSGGNDNIDAESKHSSDYFSELNQRERAAQRKRDEEKSTEEGLTYLRGFLGSLAVVFGRLGELADFLQMLGKATLNLVSFLPIVRVVLLGISSMWGTVSALTSEGMSRRGKAWATATNMAILSLVIATFIVNPAIAIFFFITAAAIGSFKEAVSLKALQTKIRSEQHNLGKLFQEQQNLSAKPQPNAEELAILNEKIANKQKIIAELKAARNKLRMEFTVNLLALAGVVMLAVPFLQPVGISFIFGAGILATAVRFDLPGRLKNWLFPDKKAAAITKVSSAPDEEKEKENSQKHIPAAHKEPSASKAEETKVDQSISGHQNSNNRNIISDHEEKHDKSSSSTNVVYDTLGTTPNVLKQPSNQSQVSPVNSTQSNEPQEKAPLISPHEDEDGEGENKNPSPLHPP